MDINTVLASALVASVVAALIAALSQGLDRRARQIELAFAKAVELAVQRTEILMRNSELSGQQVILVDNAVMAGRYFKALKKMLKKGGLPEDFLRIAAESTLKAESIAGRHV